MATITKRGDYQWQVKIRRKGYPIQSRTFDSKAEADKWARAIESEFDRGLYIDRNEAEKNTLWAILERYRLEVTPLKRGADLEDLRIKAIQKNKFTHTKMAALSAQLLAVWRDERLKEVTGSTVNRELNIVSAAINHARKEWGIHCENPIALLRRPQENRARDRRLVGDEEQRLLKELESEGRDEKGRLGKGTRNIWVKPLVQFAIETAMRRGELLALERKDVDTKTRTARLNMTKNGEARIVPLSTTAIAIFEALPASINGKVFPITEDALKKVFSRACERAQLGNLRFHDLRHEATSRLAEKLPNLIELASVTGHKDLKMLKRYYHPRAEDLARKLG